LEAVAEIVFGEHLRRGYLTPPARESEREDEFAGVLPVEQFEECFGERFDSADSSQAASSATSSR
jgi:hypothetical protein